MIFNPLQSRDLICVSYVCYYKLHAEIGNKGFLYKPSFQRPIFCNLCSGFSSSNELSLDKSFPVATTSGQVNNEKNKY